MITGFTSSHRVQSLLAICLISAGVCGAQSVQAGPTLETTENSAIGAQATFNNNWAQTFEAKGAMSIDIAGDGVLLPFEQLTTTPALLPNSGLASLTATVSNMTVDGGTLDASSFVNPEATVNGNPINPNSVVLNTSTTNGLPALQITPGTTDSSVIGASIIGTNIGTASLQVTGSLNTSVINNLTAF
ncbi:MULTISPECIES: hypothetical protein [unclassified Cyanobium]|uniref:hypothetical protein n=1 Tax=unclassified Cyanobium TaxID=2627006 RepID=UPI0020CDA456|nr:MULTISPECIES: hypothetical protein [unclassified Cyanobium]MCP9778147.1 hypothetical protein [Cyanobium sp. Tous-M-B4]MCP9876543.1 hypothetical protein [Cyanobium sp. A2C-AMD]